MDEMKKKKMDPSSMSSSEKNHALSEEKPTRENSARLFSDIMARLQLDEEQQTEKKDLRTYLQKLEHPDWYERANALYQLQQWGPVIPQPLLLNTLMDEDEQVRATALTILEPYGESIPLSYLYAALHDTEPYVREMALLALSRRYIHTDNKNAIRRKLRLAQYDRDKDVRQSARIVLQEIQSIHSSSKKRKLENQQPHGLILVEEQKIAHSKPWMDFCHIFITGSEKILTFLQSILLSLQLIGENSMSTGDQSSEKESGTTSGTLPSSSGITTIPRFRSSMLRLSILTLTILVIAGVTFGSFKYWYKPVTNTANAKTLKPIFSDTKVSTAYSYWTNDSDYFFYQQQNVYPDPANPTTKILNMTTTQVATYSLPEGFQEASNDYTGTRHLLIKNYRKIPLNPKGQDSIPDPDETNTVSVVDLTNGKELFNQTFASGVDPFDAVLSHDGQHLAVISHYTIEIWDISTSQHHTICQNNDLNKSTSHINESIYFVWTPDDHNLLVNQGTYQRSTTKQDQDISWTYSSGNCDSTTGQWLWGSVQNDAPSYDMPLPTKNSDFSPDKKQFATLTSINYPVSGDADTTLHVFEAATGKVQHIHIEHFYNDLAWIDKTHIFLSRSSTLGSQNAASSLIYSITTGHTTSIISSSHSIMIQPQFSPDYRYYATEVLVPDAVSQVEIYDTLTGRKTATIPVSIASHCHIIAWLANTTQFAMIDDQENLNVYDIPSQKLIASTIINPFPNADYLIYPSPNSQYVAVESNTTLLTPDANRNYGAVTKLQVLKIV